MLVWDLMTDAKLLLIEDPPYPLWWASFSQDNQYLWVIHDENLDKYNLANAELESTLRFPAHIGRSAAISPDEKFVVAGKYDGTMDQSTISFYPFGAEDPFYSEQMVYMISSFHFSPDSKMVSGSSSRIGALRIKIWNPETGSLLQDFVNYSGGPAFSPDSTRAAFVKENYVSVFSTDTWILQSSFRLDDSSSSMMPKFFLGENQILAISDTYNAQFVNITSGEELFTFPEQVSVINYSPASNVVFTFWNLGNIKLWGIR